MRRGFTLIEMLVVIVIIGILAAITLVGVNAALISARTSATENMILQIKSQVGVYETRWGDFPPSSLTEIGGKLPNEFNNGIETLTACLSSTQSGGVLFRPDKSDLYTNTDDDKADKNVNTWEFGDNTLREIADYFGRPLAYFHFRDYAKPSGAVTRYKLELKGAEQRVKPAMDAGTKTFVNADKFHVISAGRDGKFGTEDDIVR
jgi:prepilin-type N-terminal cleavage/methylation domain-containing protein